MNFTNRRVIIVLVIIVLIVGAIIFFNMYSKKVTPTYSTEEQVILALKNKDVSYCNVFSDNKRKNVCLSDYYMMIALKEAEVNKCIFIPLESISKACDAVIKNDENGCNNIEDEWKDICLQFIKNDATSSIRVNDGGFCKKVEESVKEFSISYCESLLAAVST